MRNPTKARLLPVVLAIGAVAWFAPAVIASQVTTQATSPAQAPVQPAAADQKLGFAIMIASVAYDGTLTFGTGVTSVAKQGLGNYSIAFERSIRSCAYMTAPSIGALGVTPSAGWFVAGYPDVADEKRLKIRLYLHDNTLVDSSFQVHVTCLQ